MDKEISTPGYLWQWGLSEIEESWAGTIRDSHLRDSHLRDSLLGEAKTRKVNVKVRERERLKMEEVEVKAFRFSARFVCTGWSEKEKYRDRRRKIEMLKLCIFVWFLLRGYKTGCVWFPICASW